MAEAGPHCMEIHVKDIPVSGKEFSFEMSPSGWNLSQEVARLAHPVDIRVRCTRRETDVYVLGELGCSFLVQCGRCLEEAQMAVHTSLEGYFRLQNSDPGNESTDHEEDDVGLYHYQNHRIDLHPMIREVLVLETPSYPLCSEGCLGICPECGLNRNRNACACEGQISAQKNPFESFFRNRDL